VHWEVGGDRSALARRTVDGQFAAGGGDAVGESTLTASGSVVGAAWPVVADADDQRLRCRRRGDPAPNPRWRAVAAGSRRGVRRPGPRMLGSSQQYAKPVRRHRPPVSASSVRLNRSRTVWERHDGFVDRGAAFKDRSGRFRGWREALPSAGAGAGCSGSGSLAAGVWAFPGQVGGEQGGGAFDVLCQ
jgi:hypothetical protein